MSRHQRTAGQKGRDQNKQLHEVRLTRLCVFGESIPKTPFQVKVIPNPRESRVNACPGMDGEGRILCQREMFKHSPTNNWCVNVCVYT